MAHLASWSLGHRVGLSQLVQEIVLELLRDFSDVALDDIFQGLVPEFFDWNDKVGHVVDARMRFVFGGSRFGAASPTLAIVDDRRSSAWRNLSRA